MSKCYVCGALLEDDGKVRRRQCARRCRRCKNASLLARRRADPVLLLQHRFYNSVQRHWPDADPALWSVETVREVCGGKSVLSQEDDTNLLCVSWVRKRAAKEELVLVTTKEAQSLAHMDEAKRVAQFPENVARWDAVDE